MWVRTAAVAGMAVLTAGCMMQNQAAPLLTGPSGFGQAITMTARPDTLPRDGSSQSLIQLNFRDGSSNEPLPGRRLLLSTSAGLLTATEVVTDAGGNASFFLIAPSLNTPVTTVAVLATAVGENAANGVAQSVFVVVDGPAVPVAAFTTSPPVPAVGVSVLYDASGTKLAGSDCNSACTYSWDFGDGTSGSGQLVEHTFLTPGVKVVILTVTAPGGTTGEVSKAFSMATPAAPTASFTATKTGNDVTLNASASTVGAGASITQYAWSFGDGGSSTGTVPITFHTYANGNFVVTLTVTDSLGRTATLSQALAVP
jgi:PKD repeat protein